MGYWVVQRVWMDFLCLHVFRNGILGKVGHNKSSQVNDTTPGSFWYCYSSVALNSWLPFTVQYRIKCFRMMGCGGYVLQSVLLQYTRWPVWKVLLRLEIICFCLKVKSGSPSVRYGREEVFSNCFLMLIYEIYNCLISFAFECFWSAFEFRGTW